MGSWNYLDINYADLLRKSIANTKDFVMSWRVWKRRYIAIALDDELSVIFDTKRKNVCGLLDTQDIDLANYMPMSLRIGASNNYRLNIHDNRPDFQSGLGLSVAIMCRAKGYFSSDEYFVHHHTNSCDNRREMLRLVRPDEEHPPLCLDSLVFMQTVFSEKGYTLDRVIAYCIKCVGARKTRLDF